MLKRRKRLLGIALIVTGFAMLTLLLPIVLLGYGPSSGEIQYTLAWDWGEAQALPDGGWTTVNDLGYTVTVEQGYLVSYSAQAIECAHSHGFLTNLLGWIMPGEALAGHGGDNDPALVTTSTVETLHAPSETVLDLLTVNEPGYCELHYLIARADSEAAGAFNAADMAAGMAATSLRIEGAYTAPGASEAIPFSLDSSLAMGVIRELVDAKLAQVHTEIGAQAIEISIVRRLDTLFDGVDFATMDADAQAWAMLRAIIRDTHFVVTGGSRHHS
jgi:hypothetical protein